MRDKLQEGASLMLNRCLISWSKLCRYESAAIANTVSSIVRILCSIEGALRLRRRDLW
jgi:hypothetical protein